MHTKINKITVNKMINWRKEEMKKEKIKNICMFVLCVLAFYAFLIYMCKVADSAYENRAKNAGYELPIEQQRNVYK